MKMSNFYELVHNSLEAEIYNLSEFTGQLDKNTVEKEEHIGEYKCSRMRYGAITNIKDNLCQTYRLRDKLGSRYYMLSQFYELIKDKEKFHEIYNNASLEERPDIGMYYGMLAYIDMLVCEKEEKLRLADDWEKIELNEYLKGYRFARKCFDEAWEKKEWVKCYGE